MPTKIYKPTSPGRRGMVGSTFTEITKKKPEKRSRAAGNAMRTHRRARLSPGLESVWLPVHVTLAFLGNAVFALAFGVSLIYLLQERHLKLKKMTALMKRFPSLESLDRINYLLLVWGFPLMTLGIVTGSMWAGIHWGNYWSWEPRQIASGIAWLFYGAILHGRITAGLRGKKAALLTMVGFCVVLGYFLWGDTMFSTRHGGRFQ